MGMLAVLQKFVFLCGKLCVKELPVWKALYFEMTANGVSVYVPLYSHATYHYSFLLFICQKVMYECSISVEYCEL
jgi:hypothetical protein